mmetsp:Transcript_42689/g.107763  ORF Transcript_42689/g.107763 Transcript_42689/m.107763 type:complete len:202 (+) Transcript_42689:471-1076(+)
MLHDAPILPVQRHPVDAGHAGPVIRLGKVLHKRLQAQGQVGPVGVVVHERTFKVGAALGGSPIIRILRVPVNFIDELEVARLHVPITEALHCHVGPVRRHRHPAGRRSIGHADDAVVGLLEKARVIVGGPLKMGTRVHADAVRDFAVPRLFHITMVTSHAPPVGGLAHPVERFEGVHEAARGQVVCDGVPHGCLLVCGSGG